MLPSRCRIAAFVLALCALSCASSDASETGARDAPREPEPAPDGVVHLPEASRPFVRVEEVSAATSAVMLRAPARVAFRDGAVSKLGAPFQGLVERVHVRTGDRVNPGDPLVTLDCPEAASIRASIVTARAAVREARAALQRQVRMLEQGVGTERERLQAERDVAEAEAELTRARAALRFAGAGSGTSVVLRAPIAGTVVSRNATVGAAVEPGGEPLVEVGDASELWVVADVFERDVHLVREGGPVQVELPTIREPLAGRVSSIGAVLEGSARTAPVRIALERSHDVLRPGMFGRASIESPEASLALPAAAILIKDGRTAVVYVETAPGAFLRRPVDIAQPIDGKVLVTAGISPGERVVVGGALLLDGAAEQLL